MCNFVSGISLLLVVVMTESVDIVFAGGNIVLVTESVVIVFAGRDGLCASGC